MEQGKSEKLVSDHVATVSFIPVEIYEMLKAPSLLKCAALVINVAIAIFLVVKVRASKG